jgi:hypothetical protein
MLGRKKINKIVGDLKKEKITFLRGKRAQNRKTDD